MSATAFVITDKKTILLSDGMAVRTEGLQPSKDMSISEDRIHGRNYRKAWKLSDSIGVLWTGNLHGFMDKYHHVFDTSTLQATARHLTEGIKECIFNSGFTEHMKQPWFNVNVHVIGYDKGKVLYYHIIKKNGRITLEDPITLPNGAAAAKAPYADIGNQFKTYLDPSDPIGSAKDAFTATLKAQPDNLPLGGEIFSEVLTP